MAVDDPEEHQTASPLGVPQGSFEDRLRVASERRAKVLAAKAAAKAAAGDESTHTTEVIPIRARKYIRSSTSTRNGKPSDHSTRPADGLTHGPAEYFETDPDPTSQSAGPPHVSPHVQIPQTSHEPDTSRVRAHRFTLMIFFLLGTAAGCIATLLWSGTIVVPALL